MALPKAKKSLNNSPPCFRRLRMLTSMILTMGHLPLFASKGGTLLFFFFFFYSDLFTPCRARSPCNARIQGTQESKACSIGRVQGTEVQCGLLAWHIQHGPRRLGMGESRKRSSLRSSLSSGGGPSLFAVPCSGRESSVAAKALAAAKARRAVHRRTHAATQAPRSSGGADRARQRARSRTNWAASGLHRPPTSRARTTSRQRGAWRSSG